MDDLGPNSTPQADCGRQPQRFSDCGILRWRIAFAAITIRWAQNQASISMFAMSRFVDAL